MVEKNKNNNHNQEMTFEEKLLLFLRGETPYVRALLLVFLSQSQVERIISALPMEEQEDVNWHLDRLKARLSGNDQEATEEEVVEEVNKVITGTKFSTLVIPQEGHNDRIMRPVTELRRITEDISYIDNVEAVFVAEENGSIYYCTGLSKPDLYESKIYHTQMGDWDSFTICLENRGYLANEKEAVIIEGDFVDVADCGEYTYAIESTHYLSGFFQ